MGSRLSKPKRIIVLSLILAGLLTLLYGYGLGFLFNNVASGIEEVRHINTQLDKPKPHTEALSEAKSDDEVLKQSEPAKSGTIAPDYPAKSVTKPADEPAKSVEQKSGVVKVEGGHIPFTYGNGVPGQPETYVDTVGECPFYEMAGAKGCVPPPNLECNEDWSVCTLKED